MAGFERDETISPDEQLEWELAYRTDLANAIGLIVNTPIHRVDYEGEVVWGSFDGGMSFSDTIYREFVKGMIESVENSVLSIPGLPDLDRTRPAHRYEHPPAAQSWPEVALMLWENIEPLVTTIDTILSLALGVQEVRRRIDSWHSKKDSEIVEQNRADDKTYDYFSHKPISSFITITQGTAITLVLADACRRYGLRKPIDVSVFPRGSSWNNDPGHPNSRLSYLIRCESGSRVFVYHVDSAGLLLEHYLLTGSEITPLPAFDLWDQNEERSMSSPGIHLNIGDD